VFHAKRGASTCGLTHTVTISTAGLKLNKWWTYQNQGLWKKCVWAWPLGANYDRTAGYTEECIYTAKQEQPRRTLFLNMQSSL